MQTFINCPATNIVYHIKIGKFSNQKWLQAPTILELALRGKIPVAKENKKRKGAVIRALQKFFGWKTLFQQQIILRKIKIFQSPLSLSKQKVSSDKC